MASYAFIAEAKGSPRRRKWSTIGGQSRMAARCFSLKISFRAAANTMNLYTIEGQPKNKKNGPSIYPRKGARFEQF